MTQSCQSQVSLSDTSYNVVVDAHSLSVIKSIYYNLKSIGV